MGNSLSSFSSSQRPEPSQQDEQFKRPSDQHLRRLQRSFSVPPGLSSHQEISRPKDISFSQKSPVNLSVATPASADINFTQRSPLNLSLAVPASGNKTTVWKEPLAKVAFPTQGDRNHSNLGSLSQRIGENINTHKSGLSNISNRKTFANVNYVKPQISSYKFGNNGNDASVNLSTSRKSAVNITNEKYFHKFPKIDLNINNKRPQYSKRKTIAEYACPTEKSYNTLSTSKKSKIINNEDFKNSSSKRKRTDSEDTDSSFEIASDKDLLLRSSQPSSPLLTFKNNIDNRRCEIKRKLLPIDYSTFTSDSDDNNFISRSKSINKKQTDVRSKKPIFTKACSSNPSRPPLINITEKLHHHEKSRITYSSDSDSDEHDFYVRSKPVCNVGTGNTSSLKSNAKKNDKMLVTSDSSDLEIEDTLYTSDSDNNHHKNNKLKQERNVKVKVENTLNNTLNAEKDINFDVKKLLKKPQNNSIQCITNKESADYLRERLLTTKCIERLYNSIKDMPKHLYEKEPQGLKIFLYQHQLQSLTWMKWREAQEPSGGILADDMGLGKTLQMISLVLAMKNEKREKGEFDSEDSDDIDYYLGSQKSKTYKGKTLVVCPVSVIEQWEREISGRCKNNFLTAHVYHGSSKSSISDSRLPSFDVVITSYHVLSREYLYYMKRKINKSSKLYKIKWERVILDEAHMIRNVKGKFNEAACELSARSRWALTGTPIQNKETDMYALLKFLKCSPFDEKPVWRKWVSNCGSVGSERLVVITKSLMLRRTKDELMKRGMIERLPDKVIEEIELELDPEENIVYQKLLLYSQSFYKEFLNQRSDKEHYKKYGFYRTSQSIFSKEIPKNLSKLLKTLMRNHKQIEPHFIFVLILKLRQMCCHPTLIQSILDKEDVEIAETLDDTDFVNADILEEINEMLNEEDKDEEEDQDNSFTIDDESAQNVMSKSNPVFRTDRKSSKIRAILHIVKKVIKKGEKIIIVSQWTSFLDIIASFLKEVDGAHYKRFTGQVPVQNRQLIIDKLNDPHHKLNILLLSLTCGGLGLNLVGASNMLIIDLHWNPQLETQAQDRIHRFGQEKNVKIWKFVCTNTIEEKIRLLQNKKLNLANNVLTGTVSNRLTFEDLELLFS